MAATSPVELESLLVKLVGDGSHYIKTLQEAEKAAKEHAKEVEEQAERSKEHLKMLGEGVEGVTNKWNALKAAVAGFIGFEIIKGGWEWLESGIEKMAAATKESQRYGLSVQTLSTLQFEAGKEADSLNGALRHFNQLLGSVERNGDKVGDAFSQIGLKGTDLLAMGRNEALKETIKRFGELAAKEDITAKGMQVLGFRSVALIPLLAKGEEGFKKAGEKAENLGYLMDAGMGAKALIAEEHLDELGKAFEGLQRTAAVEFAPLIAEAAEEITSIIENAHGGKEVFKTLALETKNFIVILLKGIKTVTIQVLNTAQQVKALIDYWSPKEKTPAEKAAAAKTSKTEKGWQDQERGDAFLMELLNPGWGVNEARTDKGAYGAAAKEFFDPIIAGINDGGDEAIKEMQKMLDKLGEAKGPKTQDDLIKSAVELIETMNEEAEVIEKGVKGAKAQMLAKQGLHQENLKLIADAQKNLEDVKRMESAIKKAEDAESPIEKLMKEKKALDMALKRGALTPEQFNRGLAKEWADIAKPEAIKHPEAAQAGTKAAYDAILRHEDSGKQDVQQQIKAKLDAMVKQEEEQTRLQARTADAIEKFLVGAE